MSGEFGALRTSRQRRRGSFRLHKPRWIDPFPHIPGTESEKRIFEALWRRKIYFRFQADFTDKELEAGAGLIADANFKPDFVIPEYRVIIDPFSDFHHTLQDAVARDARKRIFYQYVLGFAFYTPWHSEVIREGGLKIVGRITELNGLPKYKLEKSDEPTKKNPGYLLGENLGLGATSVAAANKKRGRAPDIGITVGARGGKRRSRSSPIGRLDPAAAGRHIGAMRRREAIESSYTEMLKKQVNLAREKVNATRDRKRPKPRRRRKPRTR